jgi:hypothetical protein
LVLVATNLTLFAAVVVVVLSIFRKGDVPLAVIPTPKCVLTNGLLKHTQNEHKELGGCHI